MYTNSYNARNDHFREGNMISIALVVFANAFTELLNDTILSFKVCQHISRHTHAFLFHITWYTRP